LNLAVEAPTWVIYAKTIPDPTAHLPGNLAKLGRRHVDALPSRLVRNLPERGLLLVFRVIFRVNIAEPLGRVRFFTQVVANVNILLVLVLTGRRRRVRERGPNNQRGPKLDADRGLNLEAD